MLCAPDGKEMSLTVVRLFRRRRPNAAAIALLTIGLVSLGACSNTNRGVTGSVGVGEGVALLTAGDVTTLDQGETLPITASVVNDVNNQGVTWSLQPNNGPNDPYDGPAGSLTQITSTTATFVAPPTTSVVTGEVAATITATAVANTEFASSVTLITDGTPVANPVQLFPANVNVGYAASFTVSGGLPPFTWILDPKSAPLPPGITLLGSTSGLDSISGVPTTANTYPNIILQATDAANRVVTFPPVQIVVNPQDTCILTGTFTLMVSGFRGGGGMTHVANITIDPTTGGITGEQDYKDGHRTTVQEALITPSNCTNRQTNSGQLVLEGASGQLIYNVSATPPDANGVIQSGRLQLIGSGDDTGSGLLARVDPSAITASPPTGSFAFGQIGVEKQEPAGVHFATAGRFTADSSGAISGGMIDSNNPASPLNAATLTGSLSAPDPNGRGTATFTVGGQSSLYVYYILNANKMYLVNIDPQNATTNSPRSTGFMTPQIGDVGGITFDANALANPAVLSLWGAVIGLEPITSQTMGLLSGANGSTINALIDISEPAVAGENCTTATAGSACDLISQNYTSQPYSIAANGRGTMTLASTLTNYNYNLVFYLDGTSNGYVVQQSASFGTTPIINGSGGLLEAQYPMPAGGFPSTFTGYFVGGTQFAMAPGPITLNPLATVSFGTLTSNFTNAVFYISPGNGRGVGTLTQTGIGVQPATIYIVSPTKLEVLRFSTRGVDANIDWMIQNIE
jgi:hypothetical protein